MSKHNVTLVTCAEYPALDPDDMFLASALEKLGIEVSVSVWSDPGVDWSAYELCLLRSTWDYDRRQSEFRGWLKRVSMLSKLCNDANLVEWNIDKFYLQGLADNGIDVIPTHWLRADVDVSRKEIEETIRRLGGHLVVKPSVGLGGSGVVSLNTSDLADEAIVEAIVRLKNAGTVMIQPLMQTVIDPGEHSLIFFDGKFSHAIRKSPFAQMALAGQAGEEAVLATAEQIQFGEMVIAQLATMPLYARVDVVLFENRWHLMELELIEPSLYFSYSKHAADELAALIAMRLK